MSTAQTAVTLPLTQQVVALLNALYADSRGFVHAIVGRGGAALSRTMPAGRVAFVPPWILTELEYRVPDDICLSAATTDQGGYTMLDLTCAWTELVFEPIFDRDNGWGISEADDAAVQARLAGFTLPSSLVIDNAWGLTVAWLLDRPLALDTPEGLARAESVQRGLASALDGLADDQQVIQPKGTASMGLARYATMPAWSPARPAVRLPGSYNHDRGAYGKVVTLAALHEDRRYSIADLEAALGGQKETPA